MRGKSTGSSVECSTSWAGLKVEKAPTKHFSTYRLVNILCGEELVTTFAPTIRNVSTVMLSMPNKIMVKSRVECYFESDPNIVESGPNIVEIES